MTRVKLLKILQKETDGFKEQSRLRDDVLDAMEEAYIKGKREQLNIQNVSLNEQNEVTVCQEIGCDLPPYGDTGICKHHYVKAMDRHTGS